MKTKLKKIVSRCLLHLVIFLCPFFSTAQVNTPIYYGPYSEVDGNIYVRVFMLYVDVSGWTSSLNLSTRTGQIIDNLNEVFNPYDIYFIRYDVENFCDESFYNLSDYKYLTSAYSSGDLKADALNIIDLGGSGPQGFSMGIPSKAVELYDPSTAFSEILIHEVGHCFGLIHPFGLSQVGTPDIECDATLEGEDCYSYCDLVCDIPFISTNAGAIVMESDCSASIPSGVPSDVYRNYMSYTDPGYCREEFSPEQVKRMRFYLMNHPEIIDITAAAVLPGGSISAISGDIIIESGVQEINDPLYMLPGARITVKKGARLKIYSTITAACDGMWEGIVVEGSTALSQSKSGTNYDQGWVSLYGDGLIEHAKVGIRLEAADANGDAVPLTGSGILYPCIGSFTNCTTSIKFGPQFSPTSNVALIMNADFLLDSEYRGGSSPQPIFIDMLFNTMVNIRGCNFLDSRSVCNDEKAIGIDAKASSVSTWSNDYEDLAVGLRLNQQFFGATVVNNSTYTNCYLGIETIKSSKFSIYNNDFLLGTPTGCTASESVGVTLSGNTAGLTFRKNSFSQNGSGTTIGTEVKSTMLGMNNIIFDNDYTDIDIGNIAYGFNGNAASGISYACNTHSGDEDDYIVDANGTIWEQQLYITNQGEPRATGNLFSGGSGNGSFNNSNGSDIKYYYSGSESTMNQEHFSYNSATYSGVTGVPETSNGDCADVPPCNPCHPSSIYSGLWKANFYDKRQERNDKLITLGSLTKPADIAAMQDSISNLKQVMDRNASLVLQSYAQDTTEAATLQLDSIFAWLARSENYAADLELANMYFFMNKLDKFDTLWAGISTAHNLSGDDLDEFDELGLVYDLLRPTLEEEENLAQLDESVLDSLAFWQGWCSEPGFLVKSVLLWNGISTVQDCDDPQKTAERGSNHKKDNKGTNRQINDEVIVYPNPATESATVSFGKSPQSNFRITLSDIQGHLFHETVYISSANNEVTIGLQTLPPGIYFLKILLESKQPIQAKLIILH